MGSSSMIKLLFTLAIVVVTSFLPRNPVAVPIKRSDADTHVYIYNELDLGPTLTVHCWSKDDDLGEQDLPPKFSWDFSFGLDAFGRTRFDCTFEWNVEVHKFPIYVQSRDGYACDICNWTISQAGPCRWKSDSESVCYHWEDGAKHSTEYLPTSP